MQTRPARQIVMTGVRLALQKRFIANNAFRQRAIESFLTTPQHNCSVCNARELVGVMGDEDNGGPVVNELENVFITLHAKSDVAHREDFVNQQNVRSQVCGHRKSQPYFHS